MLILVVGITGMCGQPCAEAALRKGHQVRGMGRNPNKLDKDLASRLEGFVKADNLSDPTLLEKAVKGVDAVISAMNNMPCFIIDAQLALLRAAEKRV